MAAIDMKGIIKQWGDTVVVRNLNLTINDGEFIVLLGPSGCGKTTCLRMIAGLEDPTEGKVIIDGKDVTDLDPKDRDVAMVFQSYALYPNLTVRGNIGFPLTVRKVAADEIKKQVAVAAQMVEIEDLLDRKPAELSGGQRQRVALARAVVRSPAAFLMDEPLSNLDARLRISMRAHINNLHKRLATTTIYVTHDQIEALTLADRIAIMNEGKIQQLATPEVVYEKPANLFVAGFIGSPPMNLIKGELKDGVFSCSDFSLPGFGNKNGSVVLGLRPEDIQICKTEESVFAAQIYAKELTGESTLITVTSDAGLITARGARRLDFGSDDKVGLSFQSTNCSLFDQASSERLLD